MFKYFIDLNNNKGHTFMTADWLINYNHGFLNRGLFGTLFLNIFDNQESMLDSLSFILISVYIFIFYFLSKIFNSFNQNIISVVMIFSPATFLFNIYDSQGSFRKEIIGILALVILASNIISIKEYQIYLSGFIYTIAIFSHSVNLFFFTTIIYILFIKMKSVNYRYYFLFIGSTLVNLLSNVLFSNSEDELKIKKDLICEDLDKLDLSNLCGYGSFEFLTWDLNAAFLITQNYIINENRESSYLYILLFCISILPLLFDKNNYKQIKYYLLVGISFTPLFLLAYDWGRWIYIVSICFLVIYLSSDCKEKNNKYLYAFIIYPFIFRVEHCCNPLTNFEGNFFIKNIEYIFANFLNILR